MTRFSDIFYGVDSNNIILRKPWNPSTGQFPADSTDGIIYIAADDGVVNGLTITQNSLIIFQEGNWVVVSGGSGGGGTTEVVVSDSPPSNPTEGTLWWNSSADDGGLMYIWYVNGAGNTPAWVPTAASGADGADGTDGTDGTDGVGVAVGGTTGQALIKVDDTDFNTEWGDVAAEAIVDFTPSGGGGTTTVQVPRRPIVFSFGDQAWVDFWLNGDAFPSGSTEDRSQEFEFTSTGTRITEQASTSTWEYPINAAQLVNGAKIYFSIDISTVDFSDIPEGFEVNRSLLITNNGFSNGVELINIQFARSDGSNTGSEFNNYPRSYYCAKISNDDVRGNTVYPYNPEDNTDSSSSSNIYIGAQTVGEVIAQFSKITCLVDYNPPPLVGGLDLSYAINGVRSPVYSFDGMQYNAQTTVSSNFFTGPTLGNVLFSTLEEDLKNTVIFSQDLGAEALGYTSFDIPTTADPTLLGGTDTVINENSSSATLSDLSAGLINRFTTDTNLDGFEFEAGSAVGVSSDGLSYFPVTGGSSSDGLSPDVEENINELWSFSKGINANGLSLESFVENSAFGFPVTASLKKDTLDDIGNLCQHYKVNDKFFNVTLSQDISYVPNALLNDSLVNRSDLIRVDESDMGIIARYLKDPQGQVVRDVVLMIDSTEALTITKSDITTFNDYDGILVEIDGTIQAKVQTEEMTGGNTDLHLATRKFVEDFSPTKPVPILANSFLTSETYVDPSELGVKINQEVYKTTEPFVNWGGGTTTASISVPSKSTQSRKITGLSPDLILYSGENGISALKYDYQNSTWTETQTSTTSNPDVVCKASETEIFTYNPSNNLLAKYKFDGVSDFTLEGSSVLTFNGDVASMAAINQNTLIVGGLASNRLYVVKFDETGGDFSVSDFVTLPQNAALDFTIVSSSEFVIFSPADGFINEVRRYRVKDDGTLVENTQRVNQNIPTPLFSGVSVSQLDSYTFVVANRLDQEVWLMREDSNGFLQELEGTRTPLQNDISGSCDIVFLGNNTVAVTGKGNGANSTAPVEIIEFSRKDEPIDEPIDVNTIVADYTVTNTDNNGVLRFDSALPRALIIPSGLPTGFNFVLVQDNVGFVTWAAANGVSIKNVNNHTRTLGDGAVLSFINLGNDNYVVSGATI